MWTPFLIKMQATTQKTFILVILVAPALSIKQAPN